MTALPEGIDHQQPGPPATHGRLAIGVLAGSCAVVTMTQTLVVPMLPQLPAEFGTDAGTVSWVSTSTLLVGAVANPLIGRMADLYGKRRVALCVLGVFMVGSALAAVSSTLLAIIAGRALQGIGLGLVPVCVSIVRDVVPRDQVNRGIALISAMLGIGAGLGLPVASLLTHWYDWQVVFWVSLAVAGVAFVGFLCVVPETPIYSTGRFDVVGGVWLALVLTGFLLPLSKLAQWGWTNGWTIGLLVAATVGGWGWVRYTRRTPEPVVQLSSLSDRSVLLTHLVGLTLGFAWFANLYGTAARLRVPAAFPGGFGASLVVVGLVMLPGALAMMAAARVCAWLSHVRGSRGALLVGTSIVALGYIGRTAFDHTFWQVSLGVVVVSAGMGIAYGALPALVMENVSRSHTASANSVNALARAGGSALASSVDAAIVSTWTVTIAGLAHPSPRALQLLFGAAVVGAVLAVVGTMLIPSSSTAAHRRSTAP